MCSNAVTVEKLQWQGDPETGQDSGDFEQYKVPTASHRHLNALQATQPTQHQEPADSRLYVTYHGHSPANAPGDCTLLLWLCLPALSVIVQVVQVPVVTGGAGVSCVSDEVGYTPPPPLNQIPLHGTMQTMSAHISQSSTPFASHPITEMHSNWTCSRMIATIPSTCLLAHTPTLPTPLQSRSHHHHPPGKVEVSLLPCWF